MSWLCRPLAGTANCEPGNSVAHLSLTLSHFPVPDVTCQAPVASTHAKCFLPPQSPAWNRPSPPWYAQLPAPAFGSSWAQLHTKAERRPSSGRSWSKPTMLTPHFTISAVVSGVMWELLPLIIAVSHVLSSYQRRNGFPANRWARSRSQSVWPYVVGSPLSSHVPSFCPRSCTHVPHAPPAPQLPTISTCAPELRMSSRLAPSGMSAQG